MSRDNLGNKQTVLHNCLIKNEKYDLVITPHRQKKEILDQKDKPEKNNHIKTKTIYDYIKTIYKTKKRSL